MSFYNTTKVLEQELKVDETKLKKFDEMKAIKAKFLPYYIDPVSLELKLVVKRELADGAYFALGKKFSLCAIDLELPKNQKITIEEAFEQLNLGADLQQPIPVGSLMPDPKNMQDIYEMILLHISPPKLEDEKNGIIYVNENEKYDVGVITFDEAMDAIASNFIIDLSTRLLLNELYILATEQSQQEMPDENKEVGVYNPDVENTEQFFKEMTEKSVKTTDLPDEIIEKNKQKDYGKKFLEAMQKNQ